MSESKPLNPLVMVMAINDDTRFTPTEARALVRAVRHTDNQTRLVRMSQAGIASGIEVSRDTVKRAYGKAHKFGYFAGRRSRRNEKGHKVTDYWFKSLPPLGAGEGMGTEEATVQSKVQPKVQEKAPSTSSTSSTSLQPPCFCHGLTGCPDEKALDTAPPAGPLREEPVSDQGQAPEVEKGETKPCGCVLGGGSCPTCRGDIVRPQKHPDFVLKGWHDDHLERDEGLNEYGEPIGLDY